MNKLCKLLKLKDDDELFNFITKGFKMRVTKWNYFVNWEKVLNNIEPIEKELNLLNYLIGKENLELETYKLIREFPQVVNAFPILLAIREQSIDVLIDTKDFIYKNYDFKSQSLNDQECKDLAEYIIKSGLEKIIKYEKSNYDFCNDFIRSNCVQRLRSSPSTKTSQRSTEMYV